eukprot:c22748_g1_i1 orf=276-833(+)
MALSALTTISTPPLLSCSKSPPKLGASPPPFPCSCFPFLKPFSPSKAFMRSLMGSHVPHKNLPCLSLVGTFGILAITLLSAQPATAVGGNVGRSLVDEFLALAAQEPKNALSLPTWIIHVGSVVEWVTAMALVWEYGQISGNIRWKGLSWGMHSYPCWVELCVHAHGIFFTMLNHWRFWWYCKLH